MGGGWPEGVEVVGGFSDGAMHFVVWSVMKMQEVWEEGWVSFCILVGGRFWGAVARDWGALALTACRFRKGHCSRGETISVSVKTRGLKAQVTLLRFGRSSRGGDVVWCSRGRGRCGRCGCWRR